MPAIKYKPTVPDIVRCVALGWLLAVTMEYLGLSDGLRDLAGLKSLQEMSLPRVLALTAVFSVLLTALGLYFPLAKVGRFGILGSFCLLAFTAMGACGSDPFAVLCLIIMGVLILFGIRGWNGAEEAPKEIKKAHWGYALGTAALAVLFFLLLD